MKIAKSILFLLSMTIAFEANSLAAEVAPKSTLLTVFLKHDQTKNLAEIQRNLEQNRFYETFPPLGTAVLDWHVVMGIGQILVLETPSSQVEAVKSALNRTTRGAYATETFVTEDKYPSLLHRLANKAKKTLDATGVAAGSVLMTFILKPNSQNAAETEKTATQQKLYVNFPPMGATVVSWHQAEGLGDVVVLEFPAALLRAVNLSLEHFAWKAYSTDFYASYDFYPTARDTFKLKNTAKVSR